jgi:hypothetical protein
LVKNNINTASAQMNTKYPFILTAAVLVTSAFVIGITSVPFQTALADPDRCVSLQAAPSGNTLVSCGQDKETAQEVKERCKEAKEQGFFDKCSSSQTGFGTTPNT